MSSEIFLTRVGEGNDKKITIIDEKTTIGRGPFLQVADKRVSRNHGVLEITDGHLYLTPTHTNPCFFKKSPTGTVEIMKKDEKRLLENGHIFGLLPDSLYFKVSCPVQNGTDKTKDVDTSKEETEDNTGSEEDESSEPTPVKPKKEKPAVARTARGKDMALPVEKKRKLPNWMIQMAKAPPPDGKTPVPYKQKVAKSPVKAKPAAERKRTPAKTTPARRRKTESEDDEDFDVDDEEDEEERITTKRGRGTTKSKYKEDSDEDWDEEEEYKPPKKKSRGRPAPTPRGKPRARRKAISSEEDWESEEEVPRNRRGKKRSRRGGSSDDELPSTSRASRGARAKRKSYVDDFVEFSDDGDVPAGSMSKEEDSDFVAEDDSESASDWEDGNRSKKNQRSPTKPSRTGRRRVGKKSYADSDEDFSDEDDDYMPKSKRKNKSPGKPSRKQSRKRRRAADSDDEESEESSEDDYVAPKRDPKTKKRKAASGDDSEEEEESPRKRPGRRARKVVVEEEESEEDDEEPKKDKRDEVKKVRQLKSKHRPPCMFGKKCYRKNPEHFADFSHVGDVSFDELSDVDEEDERPDCPYGPTCYRTTTNHLKQYRHSTKYRENRKDDEPQTKGKDNNEDDTGPNTYDYNDSFINDETQKDRSEEEQEDDGNDSGSGSEDSEEDISELKNEANKFMKNKKMAKPLS